MATAYRCVEASVATVHMLVCTLSLVADRVDAADRDGAAAVSAFESAVGEVGVGAVLGWPSRIAALRPLLGRYLLGSGPMVSNPIAIEVRRWQGVGMLRSGPPINRR